MTYRAIALDLDGTLLNSQQQIDPKTRQLLQVAREQQYQIYLVTGRHHSSAIGYHAELALETPLICCNGAYSYDRINQEVLDGNPLNPEQALKIVEMARKSGVHLLMYLSDAMTYEEPTQHLLSMQRHGQDRPENLRPRLRHLANFEQRIQAGDTIWKFVLSDSHSDRLQQLVSKLCDALPLSCEWSWHDRVDVALAGNCKGSRLAQCLIRDDISPRELIAFGDNYNDLSMLQLAAMGVAMGNADQNIKEQADRVTLSNELSGIAHVLEPLLTSEFCSQE
ncbi:pyridoxal phosphatase [Dongshaea marina]|uniref:pyridoxal phosphatase n=1 Tax=Dongshaea marina TaxID=2047966 RepID=UPI000D3E2829|nr:pyridoxal phosphatase [Dongshaea marina]